MKNFFLILALVVLGNHQSFSQSYDNWNVDWYWYGQNPPNCDFPVNFCYKVPNSGGGEISLECFNFSFPTGSISIRSDVSSFYTMDGSVEDPFFGNPLSSSEQEVCCDGTLWTYTIEIDTHNKIVTIKAQSGQTSCE